MIEKMSFWSMRERERRERESNRFSSDVDFSSVITLLADEIMAATEIALAL